MESIQMYRLNITGFILYRKHFITKYHLITTIHLLSITFNIERKHLFNRPENFPMGMGFILYLDICFSLNDPSKSSGSDHSPRQSWSALRACVVTCDWLWTRRLGYCHPDHQSQGIPWCTAQAQCSSSRRHKQGALHQQVLHNAVRCMATGTGFGSV